MTARDSLANDAEVLKAILTEALTTSPRSFILAASDVEGWPHERWESEVTSAIWVVAASHGDVIGVGSAKPLEVPVTGLSLSPEETASLSLRWVAPRARRRNVSAGIRAVLIGEAAQRGVAFIVSRAFGDNHAVSSPPPSFTRITEEPSYVRPGRTIITYVMDISGGLPPAPKPAGIDVEYRVLSAGESEAGHADSPRGARRRWEELARRGSR
jgi:hypothetical protein